MSSRPTHSVSEHQPSSGSRPLAFYALLLGALVIAFFLLVSGAKSWFSGPTVALGDSAYRDARRHLKRDALNAEAARARQRNTSSTNPHELTNEPTLPTAADSRSGRSAVNGHLTHELPDRLQLTMPPEFAEPGNLNGQTPADRSAPSGDVHVRDRDWRKQFPADPPLQPSIARTSLTEIRPYQEWDVHQTASDSLGRIGVAAVPALIETLSDPNPKLRAEAAYLIGRIGPDASSAVDALVTALSDPETSVQKSAARALGQIGPDAAKAVGALMRVIQETEPIGVTIDPAIAPSQAGQ